MANDVPDNKILASHYAACFATKSGQEVLKHLESLYTDDGQPTFIKNGHETHYDLTEAAIRDGRRQVVYAIRRQIKTHEQRADTPKQTKAKR